MPIIIRDAEVNALADELRRITGAKTKTEAVRRALRAQLAEARRRLPHADRFARSKALADALGPSDADFNTKTYTDEMWGDS